MIKEGENFQIKMFDTDESSMYGVRSIHKD